MVMQKIKLGIVIPTLYKGGAEKIASTLSLNLPKNIELYFILFEKKIDYPYKGKLLSINLPLSSNIFKESLNFLLRPFRIRALAKKYKLDLLLAFDEAASFSSILSGIKTIPAIHKSLAKADKQKSKIKLFLNSFFRILYRSSCKIITICDELKQELLSHLHLPKDKVVRIYNPHNIKEILSLSKENPEIPLPSNYILTIGRAEKQKGQWHLIKAFSKVYKLFPELKLVIIANGSLLPKLKELTDKLELGNSIIFIDQWVKNPYPIIKNAKLFVLSSLFEGFPNVVVESFVLKTPVVSSLYKTGISELLGKRKSNLGSFYLHERGILSEEFDDSIDFSTKISKEEQSLADAILFGLNNAHRLKEQIENAYSFSQSFAPKTIIKEYINTIKECLDKQ